MYALSRTSELRPAVITPFLDPKINVFGSQNRLANLTREILHIDPKLVIFQAYFSDTVFGSAPTRKWGSSFG